MPQDPSYLSGMRAALSSLLMLCSGPALAMNWEGHDDWMADMEPALTYEQAVPHAMPRKGQGSCPQTAEQTEHNPYEQIPLSAHGCTAAGEGQPAQPSPRR